MSDPVSYLTPPPEAPVKGEERSAFTAKANALLGWWAATFIQEMNTTVQEINTVTGTVLGIQSEVGGVYAIRNQVVTVADISEAVVSVDSNRVDISTLASLSAEVESLGLIAGAIAGVDSISLEVQGVYANMAALQSVHANLAGILESQVYAGRAEAALSEMTGLAEVMATIQPEGIRVVDYDFDAHPGHYPAGASQGDVYLVTSGGTIDGIDLSEGDMLLYIGGGEWLYAKRPKKKRLAGTTPANAGGQIWIPHGLDSQKILSISALADVGGARFPPGAAWAAGREYHVYLDAGGMVGVALTAANSSSIRSCPVTVLIEYEA